jgi:DNA helicase II / ATP-dependent DNA helicase PcrA
VDLLDGLNEAQRGAVTSDAAPLCILAGAGSGKTRVLTRRIAWRVATGSADPRHVLALTFTRKAAGELQSRLGALGVRPRVVAGTFHAVAYAQLRRLWADRGEREPALLDRKVRILARLLGPRRDATLQPIDVASEIEWAKARLVGPSRYEAAAEEQGRTPPMPAAALADLYARYEAEKHKRGLVDFDDLLLRCALAIERDPEHAAAQRWRFRHLFVDEFQDVNPLQHRLLAAWVADRADLCGVGHPNQAIYAWNGADPTYLVDFRAQHPGAGVLRLTDNYRSTPQVLAVADAVLGTGLRLAPRLRATRADGPIPEVASYPSDIEEARGIARAIRDLRAPGTPWSHHAVLTRTNAQAVLFEEAFRAAGIPYRVKGGGAFLDQPEIREALSGIRRTQPGTPFAPVLTDLVVLAGNDEAGGSADRRLELDALVRLGQEYAAADPVPTADGFLAWLAATVRGDEPERGGDAVEIVTFHRAKGLEWPVVFVAGLERGFVPIGHATDPEAVAEERRLLYVAVTRAERELRCSWAERRTFGTKTLGRAPSPWLDAVEAARAALAQGGPAADWRAHLDASRKTLARGKGAKSGKAANGRAPRQPELGRDADPDVLAALRTWRTDTARAAGMPAYLVFHDTTLAALAEALPADRQALLAVPGLGPVKAERYGDAVLAVIARTVAASA